MGLYVYHIDENCYTKLMIAYHLLCLHAVASTQQTYKHVVVCLNREYYRGEACLLKRVKWNFVMKEIGMRSDYK